MNFIKRALPRRAAHHAEEEERTKQARKAHRESAIARLNHEYIKMENGYCPFVEGSCLRDACVHFEPGYTTSFGDQITMPYPRCKLWRG